jgi:hypothetical protein
MYDKNDCKKPKKGIKEKDRDPEVMLLVMISVMCILLTGQWGIKKT